MSRNRKSVEQTIVSQPITESFLLSMTLNYCVGVNSNSLLLLSNSLMPYISRRHSVWIEISVQFGDLITCCILSGTEPLSFATADSQGQTEITHSPDDHWNHPSTTSNLVAHISVFDIFWISLQRVHMLSDSILSSSLSGLHIVPLGKRHS